MTVATPDVHAAITRMLNCVVNTATALNVDLPARHVVSSGGVVYDCEMVAVSALALDTGIANATSSPMADLMPCPPAWRVTMSVVIVRCAAEKPAGPRLELPPKVEWIEQDLAAVSADAAVIANAVQTYDSFGTPSITISFAQTEGGMIAVGGTVVAGLYVNNDQVALPKFALTSRPG